MVKVYVVWYMSGYDCDGDVCAAFENEGDAEVLAKAVRGEVKEVEFQPSVARLHAGLVPWDVRISKKGNCLMCIRSDDYNESEAYKEHKSGSVEWRLWSKDRESAIADAKARCVALFSQGVS